MERITPARCTITCEIVHRSRVPVLVIRGENSDLLSEKTVEDMRRRHPMLASVSVPNEGHAPLLWDEPTIKSIAQFFAETDSVGHGLSQKAA